VYGIRETSMHPHIAAVAGGVILHGFFFRVHGVVQTIVLLQVGKGKCNCESSHCIMIVQVSFPWHPFLIRRDQLLDSNPFHYNMYLTKHPVARWHDPVSAVKAWRTGCVINTPYGYVDLNLLSYRSSGQCLPCGFL